MSAAKKYFKEETAGRMLYLDHPKSADFYLSVWQTNRSSVPLLIWRALLFLTSVGIVLSSITIYILKGYFGYWFIYLTHWGLTSIIVATGFATVVSARCYFYGPISAEFKLPWYVKVYWVSYNITVPIAFLITIFYWSFLFEAGEEEELNHGLDIAVHGINTLLVLLLLLTSSHPTRLLHIYHPVFFALTYVFFGVIYYFAGGTDTKGNPWVYSVINWSKPGFTFGIVVLTGVLLVLMHLLTIVLARARDAVSSRWVKPPISRTPEGMPLRQQNIV